MTPTQRGLTGIVLDADGTLWDTGSAMRSAGSAGALAAWPGLSEKAAKAAGDRFRTDPTGAFRSFVAGELTFVQMRSRRLQDVAADAGLPWDIATQERFVSAYEQAFEADLACFDDTRPLLAWARGAGIPVRVLTNSSAAYTERKLAAVGLPELTGLVCSRDCLGVGKPEPEVFQHVCAELGLSPQEVLFVGDEWDADAEGAARAGLASLWLVRESGDPSEDVAATPERLRAAQAQGIRVITSLADVPGIWDITRTPVASSLGSLRENASAESSGIPPWGIV